MGTLLATPNTKRAQISRPCAKSEPSFSGNFGLGAPAELVCPRCQGVLSEAQGGPFQRFRCHVGHAFSLDSLVREQGEAMERALWAAVRSLEEGAALSRRLAGKEKSTDLRHRFQEKERTQ